MIGAVITAWLALSTVIGCVAGRCIRAGMVDQVAEEFAP
jgi:hypothetical protein